ncbi:histidine--tRNA ligase [Bacteroidota bacterium]
MSQQKPSIPKGTRDFSPVEMAGRNYIFKNIQEVFDLYAYQPIETPAMEQLSTLIGKYGEEGDRLIFKILNSGDYLSKTERQNLGEIESVKLTPSISEKALRYDLTVPFARYVVQHRNEITFPFKRYQIQPVWRADRPQKGRYREFFQCDVDVIGSDALLNEAELIDIIDRIFNKLKVAVEIKLNNRKILFGIAETIGESEKFTSITIAIDKLDKIGLEKVNAELLNCGIQKKSINLLNPILTITGSITEKISKLKEILKSSETGMLGLSEMESVFKYLSEKNIKSLIDLDLTLARGLNYYTGAIIEVKAKDVEIGSLCGGGRYDNLTGVFGMDGVSGVGISFGADRIYDVMLITDTFPKEDINSTKLMFVNFGEEEEKYCLQLLEKVRNSGINSEIYPSAAKMKKQLNYANNKNIMFVALAGENEISSGKITLKNMKTGDQKTITPEELIQELK